MKQISIAPSKIAGKGLFANSKLPKNTILFHVEGPLIEYPFLPDYRKHPHALNIADRKWILPLNGSFWRYINHSCTPNVGLKGKDYVITMREIQEGEELSIDYSITEGDSRWRLRCRCKQENCRTWIRGIRFLPWEFFEAYKSYIPVYLKELYLKEKILPIRLRPKGVFAKHKLKKGESIFKVEGPVIHYPFHPNYRMGPTWLAVGKNKWLIPLKDSPWNVLKHSCNPNSGLSGSNAIVALRTIQEGEEITIDDSITEGDPRWKRKCNCGEKKCRGVIRSIQFLPKATYQKYLPYIPPFLQKLYKTRKN